MLTINECRAILNNEAEGLSDEDIILIRDWLSIMADVLIESIENSEEENKN